jgi:hypothetical protein
MREILLRRLIHQSEVLSDRLDIENKSSHIGR